MTKHVDLTELNKVAEGDEQFMKETVALLLEEIPENLNSINAYIAQKDGEAIKKIVHKMKSSYMLIGMKEIWPIIGKIERPDTPEIVYEEVPKFVKISEEALEELKKMQNII